MFRSLWQSITKCCSSNPANDDGSGAHAQANLVYGVPRNFEMDEITPSTVKRKRDDGGDNESITGAVDLRNWHKDGTLKHEFGPIKYVVPPVEEGQLVKKRRSSPTHSEEIEMVDMKSSDVRIVEEGSIPKPTVVASEMRKDED